MQTLNYGRNAARSSVTAAPRPRTVQEITDEITDDWQSIPPRAAEIVDSLSTVEDIRERVYGEPAADLVRELLKLATGWHGETAVRIKAELTRKLNGRDKL
jgi:hypothetical protein